MNRRKSNPKAGVKGNGKVLIIGASGGIGSKLAELYAPRCEKLILMGRNKQSLTELQSRINKKGNVRTEILDLNDPMAVWLRFSACEADLVINCAGTGEIANFSDLTREREEEILRVNYLVPAMIVRQLVAHGGKRPIDVVNLCSTVSLIPHPFMASYGASKVALYSYLTAISEELRIRRVPIRLFTYLLGPTQTDFIPQGVQDKIGGKKLQMSARDAARKIAEWIEAEREWAIIGRRNRIGYGVIGLLPLKWQIRLIGAFLKRGVKG